MVSRSRTRWILREVVTERVRHAEQDMAERMRATREEILNIDCLPWWVDMAITVLIRPIREERRHGLWVVKALAMVFYQSCGCIPHTKITSIWNSQLLRSSVRAAAEM